MNNQKIFFSYLVIFIVAICHVTLSAREKKIALLYPNRTISLTTENSGWLTENFYRWELFLIQNKYAYDVIKDDDLETGISDDYSLLILPTAKCLSENEIISIKEFMNNGNSVFSTCSMGVLHSDGQWKGWDDLEQIFGISFVSEIPQKEASKIHTIFGGTAFSSNISPGFRLQITTYDKPIEVKINSANTLPFGYWQSSDVLFEGKNKIDNTTSAVYGNYGKGNFVWLGFEFSSIVGSKEHQKTANNLFKNIINYLSNNLIVQFDTWPNGMQSAAVLSCDVEFKFNFINNALDLLEQENLPAQFYILTESIDYQSFERLKKIGDVGLHGDTHVLFKWQDYNTQLNRLTNGLAALEKLTGKKPIAFRPPETFYDNTTLEVMKALNVNVLSSDFIEDRAVPQFLENYPGLLIIPKTGYDDYDIFQKLKIENIADQSKKYILDFSRTYEEGGLYSLNFHTQMQCRKEYIDALRLPIEEIKSKDVWITTHNRVYEWWKKISKLTLKMKQDDENNYLLEIGNNSDELVDDLAISLYKKNFASLNSLKVSDEGINIYYESNFNSQKIKVVIPRILPNETKKIHLSF